MFFSKWLIGLVVLITSSMLGFFTAFATVNIIPKNDNLMYFYERSKEVFSFKSKEEKEIAKYENKSELAESKTFLLLGTDVAYSGRGHKTKSLRGRTDTIMIVKLSDDKIDILSIPRDCRVNIPGFGYDKINAANVYGGPELLLKTIEENFGVYIKKYAIINTFGVVQLIDLLGGINFEIPKRMYYVDRSGGLFIDLQAGFQHLNGIQVHNFIRFRHDGAGDINRIGRQQKLITESMNQFLKPQNLGKIPQLLKILDQNISTNIDTTEILSVANKILSSKDLKERISTNIIHGNASIIHGIWYWEVDMEDSDKIIRKIGLKPLSVYSPDKEITVTE